jgi:hypothetical protein
LNAPSFSLAEAISFREEFGLETAEGAVVSAASDPDASVEFGVPLTPAEARDLHGRAEREGQLSSLKEALNAMPSYAGLYIDQPRGGVIVVSVTGNTGETAELATKLRPDGAIVEVRSVPYSRADLGVLRDRVKGDLPTLQRTSAVNFLAVDVRKNRVVIGLDPFDATVAASLTAAYGDAVEVIEQPLSYTMACNSRTDCPSPSFKGGLVITHNVSGSSSIACTSGFGSRKTTGGLANHWYMLTAGHCIFHGDGTGKSWLHNGIPAGISRAYQYCDHCSADIGVIEYNNWDTPTNDVYGTSKTDIKPITIRRSNANQDLGNAVCRSGAASNNYSCGTISGVDVDVLVADPTDGIARWANHQWQMSKGLVQGDSGAPVMYSSIAFGVAASGNSSHTNYGTLDFINGSVGYLACISAVSNPCN